MSKKNTLPDSLELLLDTMCNTFGGIMFIAISLILISSMVTNTLRTLLPKDIDARAIKKFESESAVLKEKIKDLVKQEERLVQNLKTQAPNQGNDAQEYHSLLKRNRDLQNKCRLDDIRFHSLQKENALEQEKMKQKEKRLELADAKLKQDMEIAEYKLNQAQKQAAQAKEKTEGYQQKEFSFAMEQPVQLKPYFVILNQGKLYHMGTNQAFRYDEVSQEAGKRKNEFYMKPRADKGIVLTENGVSELNSFFSNISSGQYFIYLTVGTNSFPELCFLKQYLRRNSYYVFWQYNPEFIFYKARDVKYKASY